MSLIQEAENIVAHKRGRREGQGAAGAAPSLLAPAEDGDVAADLREAEVRLTQAVTQANLTNDRLRIPLAAIAMGFGAIGRAVGALQKAVRDAPSAIREAADEARKPFDPKTEAELVERVVEEAGKGFRKGAGSLARSIDRRTAAAVAAALVLSNIASLGVGHWTGQATERAQIALTEAGLAQAFRDGPEAARAWLDLMRNNDVLVALKDCQERPNGAWQEPGGGRACYLSVRLDPPRIPVPVR